MSEFGPFTLKFLLDRIKKQQQVNHKSLWYPPAAPSKEAKRGFLQDSHLYCLH